MTDRKIEVEIDDDAQDGFEMLADMLSRIDEYIRDAHLYSREEILEVFTGYHEMMSLIFNAGLMNVELQLAIQDIENPQ